MTRLASGGGHDGGCENAFQSDEGETWDRLGVVNRVLAVPSVFSIRSGKADESARVQELREFIYGWAAYRKLIFNC